MPDFLTTPFLYLGAAAAIIPLALHLLLRNRAETVYFGAMRFLAATPKKLLRRQRLKQILLLLLRVLALLLLGLVFARPLFVGEKLPALLGEEPRAVVLLLDVSASMAANKHLEEALKLARGLLQKSQAADQISLVTFAHRIEMLAENVNPAQAEAALSKVRQRQSYGNLREAVQFADNLLAQSSLRLRQIYLLSDLQASNFAPGNLNLNSGAECEPILVAPAWQNVAITSGERIERNGQTSYVCRVRSFSQSDQEIVVQLNPAESAAPHAVNKSIKLAAQEEQIVYFSAAETKMKADKSAAFYFTALVPHDDLPEDNRYYLAPELERAARVLLVSGNPEQEFYVRQALELPSVPYRLSTTDANGLETLPLENFEAVIFAGASGLNRSAAENLLRYVQNGGGLIISFTEKPPLETFNTFLGELLPARVLASHNAARVQRGGVSLAEIDYAHPIFSIFRDPSHGDPSTVQITRYYRLEAKAGALRLAGFEDGSAALLERSVGHGKVLLWASALDISGGNFPVRSIFVPLLHQWLNYVRRAEPARTLNYVGQPIFFDDAPASEMSREVRLPNGERKTLAQNSSAVFNETEESGFYTVRQGHTETMYAINLDSRESDPTTITQEDVRARFNRERELGALPTAFGPVAPSLQEQEKHQKLWRIAMWVLLMVLTGEVWLANRTPR